MPGASTGSAQRTCSNAWVPPVEVPSATTRSVVSCSALVLGLGPPGRTASALSLVATGKGATQGVLFRDAAAIENFRKVDTLIIDKTGTLTEGRPAFDRAIPVPGVTEEFVIRTAASLDQGSEHPLAEAIVSAARKRGYQLEKPEQFESGTGIGVRGLVVGASVALGNTALMEQLRVDVSPLIRQAEGLRKHVDPLCFQPHAALRRAARAPCARAAGWPCRSRSACRCGPGSTAGGSAGRCDRAPATSCAAPVRG